jgi:hypothetical protein
MAPIRTRRPRMVRKIFFFIGNRMVMDLTNEAAEVL